MANYKQNYKTIEWKKIFAEMAQIAIERDALNLDKFEWPKDYYDEYGVNDKAWGFVRDRFKEIFDCDLI